MRLLDCCTMFKLRRFLARIWELIRPAISAAFWRRAAVAFGWAAVLAALVFVVQVAPEWQLRRAGIDSAAVNTAAKLTPEAAANLQNEMRKTVLQAVGGLLAVVALIFTYRRVRVAEKGHITDRYTKAIEQLGAMTAQNTPNIEVRLGAIYALERIAQDSPRDHWPIMEVLTAYVRQNARYPEQAPTEEENQKAIESGPSTEVQAILTVLGRRKRDRGREREGQSLDLLKSDLRGADFFKAHLEGAQFNGAHLEGAEFGYAYLKGAKFDGAHLEGARFYQAYLEGARFVRAHLKGALFDKAHLEGALFYGAEGISKEQFKDALGVELAYFDDEFRLELNSVQQEAATAEEESSPLKAPSNETRPAEEDAG